MQQCIASHCKPCNDLLRDVNATQAPLHGRPERGHFQACDDNDCSLPQSVCAGPKT